MTHPGAMVDLNEFRLCFTNYSYSFFSIKRWFALVLSCFLNDCISVTLRWDSMCSICICRTGVHCGPDTSYFCAFTSLLHWYCSIFISQTPVLPSSSFYTRTSEYTLVIFHCYYRWWWSLAPDLRKQTLIVHLCFLITIWFVFFT